MLSWGFGAWTSTGWRRGAMRWPTSTASWPETTALESVLVTDPFGHQYRPVWHAKHRHLGHAGFLSYVEVPVRRRPRG